MSTTIPTNTNGPFVPGMLLITRRVLDASFYPICTTFGGTSYARTTLIAKDTPLLFLEAEDPQLKDRSLKRFIMLHDTQKIFFVITVGQAKRFFDIKMTKKNA